MPSELRLHNYVRRGVVCWVYGDGKLKTSACAGLMCRACAYRMSCALLRFAKLAWASRERGLGASAAAGVWREHKPGALEAASWCALAKLVGSPRFSLVVVDEIGAVFKARAVLERLLSLRPRHLCVVGAGRRKQAAHALTHSLSVRHHFELGVSAQPGIEY
ncbi:putative cob(I)alamin adenosyltransferase [Candidatus Hodgkinia cicadicola Dsem]|nr:putative cob(I)alamin adenosyltransferase [Candidatus Hodgkinia cicadicola Dsem]